jgi:hypothetical protein
MSKSLIREIAYSGRIVHSDRFFSENLTGGLGDLLIRIWKVFRQKSYSDKEILINRSESPRKFEEIRDWAHLDIQRNIH